MDVDSRAQAQAETSTDIREQAEEVTGVQLYDNSKSAVRHLHLVPVRFF